jgi:KGK domain
MTDQSKPIIPDSQSVARLSDQEIIDTLNSNGTFVFEDFIEAISDFDTSMITGDIEYEINRIFCNEENGEYLRGKLESFIKTEVIEKSKIPSLSIIVKALFNGVNCDLLEPNGQGWQKGKIKILFEFMPEENENQTSQPIVSSEQTQFMESSLDGIRKTMSEVN